MTRGLFFTGTDTGVGKTLVTATVAHILNQQGRPFRVCKPVATEAHWTENRWLNEDTVRLAKAAGLTGNLDSVTPWAFPDPVAPPVAARRQGVRLELPAIVEAVRHQGRDDQAVLVEGVGGLLCPLTETATVADLAAALGLPLVVVARQSLGTLNHTLLTLEAARRRGLMVAGVVVNAAQPVRTLAEQTNVEELLRWLQVPLLAVVPFQQGRTRDVPPALAEVDWWRLCLGEDGPAAKPTLES